MNEVNMINALSQLHGTRPFTADAELFGDLLLHGDQGKRTVYHQSQNDKLQQKRDFSGPHGANLLSFSEFSAILPCLILYTIS